VGTHNAMGLKNGLFKNQMKTLTNQQFSSVRINSLFLDGKFQELIFILIFVAFGDTIFIPSIQFGRRANIQFLENKKAGIGIWRPH